MVWSINEVNFKQFSDCVVRPTLRSLSSYSTKPYYSEDVVALLMATMAQESHGDYIRQEGGPAVGFFQMEPDTFYDIWCKEIKDKNISGRIKNICNMLDDPVPVDMISNLRLAVIMARLFYWRIKEPLPNALDVEGLWNYYKKHWNTDKGKATQEEFMENYNKYCKGLYDGTKNR